MRFTGWCGLVIGVLMLAQWAFFLASGSVPEVHSEPVALGFHLAAEVATAGALLIAGFLLLSNRRSGIALGLVANGMLIYTVLVSPGYFGQKGEWPLTGMFALLLAVAVASIIKLSGSLASSGRD